MACVVLIDGDPLQARLIVDNLGTIGHAVLWSRQSWDGLVLIHRSRPELVIVDSAVPQCFEMLTILRAMRGLHRVPLLLIACRRPPKAYVKQLAIADWIARHFDAESLVQQVQAVIQPAHMLSPHAASASPGPLVEPPTPESIITPH